jgi:hypothetical protein
MLVFETVIYEMFIPKQISFRHRNLTSFEFFGFKNFVSLVFAIFFSKNSLQV